MKNRVNCAYMQKFYHSIWSKSAVQYSGRVYWTADFNQIEPSVMYIYFFLIFSKASVLYKFKNLNTKIQPSQNKNVMPEVQTFKYLLAVRRHFTHIES